MFEKFIIIVKQLSGVGRVPDASIQIRVEGEGEAPVSSSRCIKHVNWWWRTDEKK